MNAVTKFSCDALGDRHSIWDADIQPITIVQTLTLQHVPYCNSRYSALLISHSAPDNYIASKQYVAKWTTTLISS
jgi:hypothetical protein